MSNFEAALLHGLKVLGHVALSAAITGVFAYIKGDATFMVYTPVVNVVEAALWKWLFPDVPVPTA